MSNQHAHFVVMKSNIRCTSRTNHSPEVEAYYKTQGFVPMCNAVKEFLVAGHTPKEQSQMLREIAYREQERCDHYVLFGKGWEYVIRHGQIDGCTKYTPYSKWVRRFLPHVQSCPYELYKPKYDWDDW